MYKYYLFSLTVKKILFENGKAVGVSIVKGQQEAVDVFAPIIISGAGVFNTQTMVPREIFSQSRKCLNFLYSIRSSSLSVYKVAK